MICSKSLPILKYSMPCATHCLKLQAEVGNIYVARSDTLYISVLMAHSDSGSLEFYSAELSRTHTHEIFPQANSLLLRLNRFFFSKRTHSNSQASLQMDSLESRHTRFFFSRTHSGSDSLRLRPNKLLLQSDSLKLGLERFSLRGARRPPTYRYFGLIGLNFSKILLKLTKVPHTTRNAVSCARTTI